MHCYFLLLSPTGTSMQAIEYHSIGQSNDLTCFHIPIERPKTFLHFEFAVSCETFTMKHTATPRSKCEHWSLNFWWGSSKQRKMFPTLCAREIRGPAIVKLPQRLNDQQILQYNFAHATHIGPCWHFKLPYRVMVIIVEELKIARTVVFALLCSCGFHGHIGSRTQNFS